MADSTLILYGLVGVASVLLIVQWRFNPLYPIPTVGPSAPLLSYLGTYRFFRHGQDVLQEGYDKYKVFKVAMLDQWMVVVSGSDMNEELHRIPDSHMSFVQAAEEFLQTRHTIAPEVYESPIHLPVIRGALTRNLNIVFADVVDEIRVAFNDTIPEKGDEWVNVHVLSTMANIVARASNRVFVGLPLCREPVYLNTVVNFTYDVMKGRTVLSLIPGKTLKEFVGRLLPWAKRAIRQASAYLRPMIEDRQRKLQKLGKDWSDRPNDFLMWLIEEAQKVGFNVDLVVQGVLVSNFAAIHTSSHSITHAMYHLAVNPEYMQLLREEVEAVIKEHGWTKTAIGKMWKLDSFMRESQRVNGVTAISVMRKALQDVTLSDGTYLPAGTLVAAAASATHRDEEYYDLPDEFKPFRFSEMRGEEGEQIKHQFVSTSPEYVPFGHGKHACPGRFFAVNELKVMMAHTVLNYDVKFEDGRQRPENQSIWYNIIPNPNAKVMFRKRKVVSG